MIQPNKVKTYNKIQNAGHIFNSNTPRFSQGHATPISNGFDRSIYRASDDKTTEWNFRKHDDEGAWEQESTTHEKNSRIDMKQNAIQAWQMNLRTRV